MNIEEIDKMPVAQGKRQLKAHFEGKHLHYKGAVLAKCYECTNGYIDGRVGCGVPACPLFPFQPYNTPQNSQAESVEDQKNDDPAMSGGE